MAEDFAAQVDRFARLAVSDADKAVRGVSIALFRDVIKATPVDTGRARANWMASDSRPAVSTTESTDKSGAPTITAMTAFVQGAHDISEFTLANNLPYIATLEYGGFVGEGPNITGGYSRQAPQGMVRVNAARFEQLLEAAARRVEDG